MKTARPTLSKWSNLGQIYQMMLKYWYVLVLGLIAMLLYALLSGVSITLVVPLFDYVFKSGKTDILYHDSSSFLNAAKQATGEFLAGSGSLLQLRSLESFGPLWEQLKGIMLRTDSQALLYVICLFVLVTIVLKNVFYYLQRVLFVTLRGNTVRDVRNLMFRRYMGQSLEFFSQNRVGDAIVRMVNDVEIVSDQFIRSLLEALRDIVTIVIFLRIALLLNSRLFLYSLVVVPIFAVSVSILGKKIKKYSRRIQSQLSNMFSAVEEALNSMKIVKAFRREDSEYANFSRINRSHLRLWKKSQYYTALNLPISEISTVVMGLLVVIIGGKLILEPNTEFSLGDFTAFLFALFSMLHPLKSLTQIYIEIRKALVSLDRIALVMNTSSKVQDAPDAIDKPSFDREISFDRVGFYYKEGNPVLREVSLSIRKGEKVAFVGASGGGKTTLANLLNRMYDVKEGAISIDGTDIRQIKLMQLRRLFGVVTQDSLLFTKTVRDNIAYGSLEAVSDEQVRNAARIAHAEEFILQLPQQYDEPLQAKGSNLSGGQRQRLCIARAVVGDPPILVFDEATSALDTENERKVQDAIDAATVNRTVIMIAHRLSTVLKADKIVVLEHGRVVGSGTHTELLESCKRYQDLYNMQFQPRQSHADPKLEK